MKGAKAMVNLLLDIATMVFDVALIIVVLRRWKK
jgi:hypothetical protein